MQAAAAAKASVRDEAGASLLVAAPDPGTPPSQLVPPLQVRLSLEHAQGLVSTFAQSEQAPSFEG